MSTRPPQNSKITKLACQSAKMQLIRHAKIRWKVIWLSDVSDFNLSYDNQMHLTKLKSYDNQMSHMHLISSDFVRWNHMHVTHLIVIWLLSDNSSDKVRCMWFIWLSHNQLKSCTFDFHLIFIWFCLSDVFCHMTFRKFIENSWYKKIKLNEPKVPTSPVIAYTTSTRDRLHNQY